MYDKNTKKELLKIFKAMLDSGEMNGKLGNLKPEPDGGFLQTQWEITITKDIKRV